MPPKSLAERAAAAQAAAHALITKTKSTTTQPPKPAATLASALQTDKPATKQAPQPKPKAPAKHAAPPQRKTTRRKNSASKSVFLPHRYSGPERSAIVAALRAITTRPEGLAAIEAHVMDSLAAAIAGARIPGKEGAADRQVVFRLAGISLGLARDLAPGGKGDAASAIRQVGDRLERALARQQSGGFAASGRVPVTLDAESDDKPASDMAFHEHTPRLSQPMPVSDAPARPPRQPDILAQLVDEMPDWMDE